MKEQALWAALVGMRIARQGAAMSFEERLGREQSWSPETTARVMEEYRRFLYLALTGGDPVTPCKAVDAAWHLHLTFTRHYWDELCGRIAGRPLHHEPTEGGEAEAAHYRTQYRATLEAYERAFGAAPPADLWPEPDLATQPRQVIRGARHVLPKLSAAIAGTLLLAACTAMAATTGSGGEEERSLLEAILGLVIIGGIIYLVMRRVGRSKRTNGVRRGGAAGGAYGGSDGNDWSDNDSSGSDGGSSCGSSCGGGGD